MTEFTYAGLTFKPLKRITGKASNFEAMSKRISDIGITPENWSYERFYKVAEENGAGEIDLFEVNGKVVVAATNYLFRYR